MKDTSLLITCMRGSTVNCEERVIYSFKDFGLISFYGHTGGIKLFLNDHEDDEKLKKAEAFLEKITKDILDKCYSDISKNDLARFEILDFESHVIILQLPIPPTPTAGVTVALDISIRETRSSYQNENNFANYVLD